MDYSQYIDDKEKVYDCKCPKCQKFHKVKMFWEGNGTPRIYCKLCSISVENMYLPPPYSISDTYTF